MSTQLFPKVWKVSVDTLDISALDLEFRILRNLKSETNKCTLALWNVNPTHRAQLLLRNRPSASTSQQASQTGTTAAQGISVKVEAGYTDNTSVLFAGDLRGLVSDRSGTDWKTTLSGDDGGRACREGRINTQFTAGTSIGTILQQCAQALGLGKGNIGDYTNAAQIAGIGSTLRHTITLSGNVARELDRLCSSIGVTWSIQSGTIQLLGKGKALGKSAIVLSPKTGLLGSPEVSIDSTISLGNPQQFNPNVAGKTARQPKPKSTSVLKFTAMLIPGLTPGRIVEIQSAAFNGNYELVECLYQGQTWSQQWEVACVGRINQS